MNVATPKKQANTFSPPPAKKKKKKIHEQPQLELFYTGWLGSVRMLSLSLSVRLKEAGLKGSVQSQEGPWVNMSPSPQLPPDKVR